MVVTTLPPGKPGSSRDAFTSSAITGWVCRHVRSRAQLSGLHSISETTRVRTIRRDQLDEPCREAGALSARGFPMRCLDSRPHRRPHDAENH